jgi:hypothetical protein
MVNPIAHKENKMGCSACSKKYLKEKFVATFKDGTSRTYNSEIEAQMAVKRNGGSYRKVK